MCSIGSKLQQKVEYLEQWFKDLQEQTQLELAAKKVSVEAFLLSLPKMPCSIKAEHEQYLEKKYPIFKNADSINDIFFLLSLYISFIDYSLLEHIIKHFGSPELNDKMRQYALDMEQFRKKTTVSAIIPHLSGRPEPPPEYIKMKIGLDFDASECTLEELEQIRVKLGREFSLSKYVFFLHQLNTSSIVVVCLIPTEFAGRLKEHARQTSTETFFKEVKLMDLTVDMECLYSLSSKVSIYSILLIDL